ncbi:MAG: hypothetical protein EKK48_12115 [Candidatus Melainabacteria bacterium]|nr:MAG: hypothetical protein EKK48_12115 [Candidatus Melainabacteria bacterium]
MNAVVNTQNHKWTEKEVGRKPLLVWFLQCDYCGSAVPVTTAQRDLEVACPALPQPRRNPPRLYER